MAKALATMTIPIFTRIGGREIEIGTLEFDVKVTASGAVKAPRPSEIIRSLKNVKAR